MRQRKHSFLLFEVLIATVLIGITGAGASAPVRAYTQTLAKLRDLEMERLALDAFIEAVSTYRKESDFHGIKQSTSRPLSSKTVYWTHFGPQKCRASYRIANVTTSPPHPQRNGETIKNIHLTTELEIEGRKHYRTFHFLAYGESKKTIDNAS